VCTLLQSYWKSNKELYKLKSDIQYCLTLNNSCKNIPEMCGVLYDYGVKLDTRYLDFEPGNELWNRLWVSISGYKSLLPVLLTSGQKGRLRLMTKFWPRGRNIYVIVFPITSPNDD